jgi:hypothetical protein
MDNIELSGKKYPIRFDFRALKEFKALTGNDVLKEFDPKDSHNIVILTYTALKSGFFFVNPSAQACPITEEDVSRLLSIRDVSKVIAAFMEEVNSIGAPDSDNNSDVPGEIPGVA